MDNLTFLTLSNLVTEQDFKTYINKNFACKQEP